MLGSLILYLKGMRTTMFQLSGFYCTINNNGIFGVLEGVGSFEVVFVLDPYSLVRFSCKALAKA